LDIGIVTSIQSNHKDIETARKGEEVCLKIEPIPGETPKMVGRHFEETDLLVSKARFPFNGSPVFFYKLLQRTKIMLLLDKSSFHRRLQGLLP